MLKHRDISRDFLLNLKWRATYKEALHEDVISLINPLSSSITKKIYRRHNTSGSLNNSTFTTPHRTSLKYNTLISHYVNETAAPLQQPTRSIDQTASISLRSRIFTRKCLVHVTILIVCWLSSFRATCMN